MSQSLPEAFVAQMQALLPDYADFARALSGPAPVAVRLNPAKARLHTPSLPWCRLGHALPERPIFALDPRWHAGAYYVQDASCMVLEPVLAAVGQKPLQILDACAAPGGKSTHMAALFPEALIVANEVIHSRAAILAENCRKWGSANLVVTRRDPADFASLPDFFDLVLADVPCSGEGLFRKDPAACAEWSPAQVELCARRQRRILADLWPCLRPGGLLLYSTCTYNRQENEAQIDWLTAEFGAEVLPLDLPPAWPMAGQDCLRCYPHHLPGEGFFLAVVRKPDDQLRSRRPAPRLESLPAKDSAPVAGWLTGDWLYGRRGQSLLAWPAAHVPALSELMALKPLIAGLELAEAIGKGEKGHKKGPAPLRPSPDLALATALRHDAFPRLQLDLSQAIAYLQGQALYDLPAGTGYALACFDAWPLGWIKRVEQRANNLYPQGWRLRMQPDDATLQQAWHQLESLLPLQAA